jgi:iron complex transport system substrate-binding protein
MRILIPLLLAALALSGCSGDDEPAAAAERPVRVVALDFPSADAAIALGVVPVAMADITYVEGGIQAWTREALGGRQPELLDIDAGIPLEKIAALRPDVILATNTVGLAESRDELERIAPVVAGREGIDPWQDVTTRIGRALGREERARELVADVEAQIAGARRFEGRTISFFNFWEGSPWVINSESDFSIRFLSELGFEVPPAVAALKGEEGRAKVSLERLGVIEADVIMGTSPTPDALDAFARGRLFRRLDGAWLSLDIGPATSMAFPSVLSIPYALEELVPRLEEAVR